MTFLLFSSPLFPLLVVLSFLAFLVFFFISFPFSLAFLFSFLSFLFFTFVCIFFSNRLEYNVRMRSDSGSCYIRGSRLTPDFTFNMFLAEA